MPASYSKIFIWGLGLTCLSTAAPLENTVPASEVSTQDKLQMNPACKSKILEKFREANVENKQATFFMRCKAVTPAGT
jgi:hypothetical protein